jgi:AbrB family looped-hinge helix DNA binding protein
MERLMANAASARTRVSTKGQVILPKAIRDKRHWTAGTELTVEETAEGVLLRPAPTFAPTRFDDVASMLRGRAPVGRTLTIEDMDAAIAAEAKSRAGD